MKRILFLALLAAIASSATPSAHRFTNANLTLVNNTGACCYRAVFMNGSETSYQFLSSGSKTFPSAIVPGVYTLGVAPIGGSSTTRNFSWSIGPDGGSQSGTSATFYNVNVTSGSTITVSIN